jgi:hypothetical protein
VTKLWGLMERDYDRQTSSGRQLLLWIGLLLPPLVWALQMEINYWLLRGACARGSSGAFLVVLSIALLLVGLAALSAWLSWRRLSQNWLRDAGLRISRSQFMAMLGMFSSGMFFLVIVAQGIGALVFHPCQL